MRFPFRQLRPSAEGAGHALLGLATTVAVVIFLTSVFRTRQQAPAIASSISRQPVRAAAVLIGRGMPNAWVAGAPTNPPAGTNQLNHRT